MRRAALPLIAASLLGGAASPTRPADRPRLIAEPSPAVQGPPSFLIQPQITVPPAPPPAITIQVPPGPPPVITVPPQGFWKTWLPVFVAVLSASIAAFSARLASNAQRFGFRKDAAAVAREIRARRTTAAMQAFENNVARPVGMVLDLLEGLVGGILRTRPVDPAALRAEVESGSALLIAEYASALRLCTEADGGLSGANRSPFQVLLGRAELDGKLNSAVSEALGSSTLSRSALAAALAGLAEFKVATRRLLEEERVAEQRRWTGDLREDPFYPELIRWLDPEEIERLLGSGADRTAATRPASSVAGPRA